MVPPLDEMRRMSDVQLLELRTAIAYDRGVISGQIKFSEDDVDDEWRRRAMYAQHVREFGLGCIRNILAERSAARRDEPTVALARWLEVLRAVVLAARALSLAENDDNVDIEPYWIALDEALARHDQFVVHYAELAGADE
jgi:hypothetical protein